MKPVVMERQNTLDDLNTVILTGANWSAPNLHLCTLNFVPNARTPLSVFLANEASFTSYFPAAIIFMNDGFDVAGPAVVVWQGCQITSDGPPGQTIYTWFLTDAANAILLASGEIPGGAIGLAEPNDMLNLVIKTGLGSGSLLYLA